MKRINCFALLLIILISLFMRIWLSNFSPILLDYDAFYHARIAKGIYEDYNIPEWDTQELGGIPYYYPPAYHIWIAIGKFIFPTFDYITIGSLLNVLFGIIALLFVYCLGRTLNRHIGIISATIFSVTPVILLRAGLWARPIGLSILLAIALVYSLYKLKDNIKWGIVASIIEIIYFLAHSSVIIVLVFIIVSSLSVKDKKYLKNILITLIIPIIIAALYYSRFIPYLNFSLGYTSEYKPLISPLREVPSVDIWWAFSVLLFYFSVFNLTNFPLILHGIYIFFKKNTQLALFSSLSLSLIFFKANLFVLFVFMICILIATSLYSIYKLKTKQGISYGMPLSLFIFLSLISLNLLMTYEMHGEKVDKYVSVVQEVLLGAELTDKDLILTNNPNIGHAIAYYSNASTFLSDLTDTKKWTQNKDLFNKLMKESNFTNAKKIMLNNNINYLLIVNSTGERMFPFINCSELEIIKISMQNNATATLLKIKWKTG